MYKRDLELDRKWGWLLSELDQKLGKRPKDLNGVLFLIGVQELGRGSAHFSKEEKQAADIYLNVTSIQLQVTRLTMEQQIDTLDNNKFLISKGTKSEINFGETARTTLQSTKNQRSNPKKLKEVSTSKFKG